MVRMKFGRGGIGVGDEGPVPERPISANPGLKFCPSFVFYLPMHQVICDVIAGAWGKKF